METKYFEYNSTSAKGKYMEVTEAEFQSNVMESEGRFYIPFGTCVLECSEIEYREYANERNRHRYLSQNSEKKQVTVVSIDDVSEQVLAIDGWVDELLEKVALDEAKEKLRIALSELSEYERFLITEYYYKRRKQSEIAKVLGEKQQNISYQIQACLAKLAELMKK